MTKNNRALRWGACLFFTLGCGQQAIDAGGVSVIEIAGSWSSQWGDETIGETHWNTASLIRFDNTENTAMTQMPADDEYNPSKFSNTVWTEPVDGSFYYCTFIYGLANEADAQAASNTTDANDLDGEGCGGFPWTKLEPR
jgi:hypothetical protein